jgi:hypothetical protein
MQARRIVLSAQEGILAREASDLGVVEASLCKPELGFFVVDVASKPEAVLGGCQLARKAVVPPDVQVVAGRCCSRIVRQVDDGSEAIEAEVLPGFV